MWSHVPKFVSNLPMKNLHNLYLPRKLMCLGHKLIPLGLKKQGWCYNCRHSGQDNYICRKTNYYCQSLARTVLNCIYLRACYHQNIVKTKHRIFSAEVWYIQINFSFTILMLQNHLYVTELLMLLNLQKNSAWLIFSSEFQ